MAHPIGNENRGHRVERERVSHIAGCSSSPKHYARGGSVHSDEAEDRALIRKEVKGSALKGDGKMAKGRVDKAPRRARGGHVKHKGGGKTNVNVIVAPGGQHPPAGGAPMGAAPPPMPAMPPKPPMMPPPGGAPPMAGLGAPPPGGPPMPPRSEGGRAYASGGTVKGPKSSADMKGKTGIGDRTPIQHSGNKSDTQNIGRGPVITRAAGGPIYSDGKMGRQMAPKLPSGSGGGKARKAKAHMQNKAGHEPWEPGVER
jgi:hypothetical protein